MAKEVSYPILNLRALNLKVSPFLNKDGELLRRVNLDSNPYGALRKRSGYNTFLGTADGSAVETLFSWTKEDGSLFLYRQSGSSLYYSTSGTGAWTKCGNGTITPSAYMGHAVLADTLLISQDGGTTRHSTSGTSFSDTSLAPAGQHICSSRDNRIYIGSASYLFWSAAGSGTDWSTAGTSDSSSLVIPGEGKINSVFYANDRVVVGKESNIMYRWDGYNLYKVPTNEAPDSARSLDETEDYWLYLNRDGYFGYNGDRPQLLSNSIENQIYNNSGSAIVGTVFDNAPGVSHHLDYYCSVGTVTDEITEETISNCIQRYNYQYDQWDNYQFAHKPNSWCSYKDASAAQQLIFDGGSGQCYQVSGTATADNTSPIEAVAEGVLRGEKPWKDKLFKRLRAFASPGCNAKLQIAVADSFRKDKKNWIDIGDLKTGYNEYEFKGNTRGKLLFYRLSEVSTNPAFIFYGFDVDYEEVGV
jgi:hypothetical protein